MILPLDKIVLFLCGSLGRRVHGETAVPSESGSHRHEKEVQERIIRAKMDLWSRGAFSFREEDDLNGNDEDLLADILEYQAKIAPLKLGPVRRVRSDTLMQSSRSGNSGFSKKW